MPPHVLTSFNLIFKVIELNIFLDGVVVTYFQMNREIVMADWVSWSRKVNFSTKTCKGERFT